MHNSRFSINFRASLTSLINGSEEMTSKHEIIPINFVSENKYILYYTRVSYAHMLPVLIYLPRNVRFSCINMSIDRHEKTYSIPQAFRLGDIDSME